MGGIPHSFYRSVPERIIVDRCKAWMMPPNVDMIRRYITPDPKVIVMTRPVEEIVASRKEINRRNGRFLSDEEILTSPNQPLMRPLAGLEWATENNNGQYLFVEYANLVDHPADTVAGNHSPTTSATSSATTLRTTRFTALTGYMKCVQ